MNDRELTEWLGVHVMDWALLGVGEFQKWIQGEIFICWARSWTPLNSLDDARLLEDRLRELGLDRQYARELFDALLESKQYSVGAADYIYATARQRCEAVKRTWETHRESI